MYIYLMYFQPWKYSAVYTAKEKQQQNTIYAINK